MGRERLTLIVSDVAKGTVSIFELDDGVVRDDIWSKEAANLSNLHDF